MQLHGSLQDLRQGDDIVTLYLQKAKGLFDKLAAAGRPISLTEFNLYVFRRLHGEFQDLVTSLLTKLEPLTYSELYSHLSTHEFKHKNSLQSIPTTASLLPIPSLRICCTACLCWINGSGSSYHRGRGRREGWRGNSNSNYNQYPSQPYRGNSRSSS